MGEFIPILGIIMIIVIVITTNRRKLEEKRLTAARNDYTSSVEQVSGAQTGRIADLEDRVRVLERIVTDRGYDLADQIEALRDQRREDARSRDADSGVALDLAKKEQA